MPSTTKKELIKILLDRPFNMLITLTLLALGKRKIGMEVDQHKTMLFKLNSSLDLKQMVLITVNITVQSLHKHVMTSSISIRSYRPSLLLIYVTVSM